MSAARRSLALAALLLLSACGKPVGSPCSIQGSIQGSGFHARHDCATQCLSRWAVNCPNGERTLPQVCAGASGCQPGSCPQGQVCYHFDDPFDLRSYCVPDTICGDLANDDIRQRWELDSMEAAAAMRAQYEAKRQRRSGATKAPAVSVPSEPIIPQD